MSKNKFNKSWMKNHLDDPFVKMAQKEGYRARAAYKLIEIDEDAHLIKPGQVIVDLGSTREAGLSTSFASWEARVQTS